MRACSQPDKRRHEPDIARDGEMWKETAFLNHVTDATPQRDRIPRSRRLSFNADFARGRRQQAIDEFQRRRFAAA